MNDLKKYMLLTAPFYLGLFIALFMLFKCDKSTSSTHTIIHRDSSIVYLKDTEKHLHVTNNLFPVSSTTFAPPSVNIDTAAIISAFYTKHYYKQDLGDSLISITTEDSIQCNSIDYSKITWQFKKPYQVTKTYTITETKTIDKTKGLYLGAYMELNHEIFGLGPQANFILKNNNIGLGINVLNRSAVIQYSHKIGK